MPSRFTAGASNRLAPAIAFAAVSAALFVAFGLSGCAEKKDVAPELKTVVEGKVTLDGKPIENGIIQMRGVDAKASETDQGAISNGTYKLTTRAAGMMRVEIWAPNPEATKSVPHEQKAARKPVPADLIPAKYNEDSTLTVKISRFIENTRDFDLKTAL